MLLLNFWKLCKLSLNLEYWCLGLLKVDLLLGFLEISLGLDSPNNLIDILKLPNLLFIANLTDLHANFCLHGLIIGLVAKYIPSKEWSDRLSYRDKQISLFDLYRRYSFILCQLK